MIMKCFTSARKEQKYNEKFLGFDIETSGNKNDFVLACFYGNEVQKVCYTKEEVIKFINKKEFCNYKIYATNLGFDFLGTFYEHSDRWTLCERQGTIYHFKWFQNDVNGVLKNPVTFYDTMRILPFGVEKLGQILKIPKMPYPKCFKRKPKSYPELKELQDYCMNDARISFECIKNIVLPFVKKYNIPLKSTIGSISLQDYKNNHLPFTLFQEPEQNREIAFKSYYGGRTETFMRGLFDNVFCFDINSLYPTAMLESLPNPNKTRHHKKGCIKYVLENEGVSEVLVKVPESLKFPPLPYKKDDRLIFPTGTFKGYYNHVELRNAMKHGVEILDCGECLIYQTSFKFFKDFVNLHYNERLKLKKLNDPLEVMEKLVLNNLYGKFAFNYMETSTIIPEHAFEFDKHILKSTFVQPLLDNRFLSISLKNNIAPDYSFPIFSSYITSIARIIMYKYLSDPKIQNKIISTDTDSIFIKDYNNEILTGELIGEMKLEDGYPINEGYFVRPKMYKTFKPKCKGLTFPKNKEVENQMFQDILNKKSVKQERFIKFRTAIRSKESHKYGILKPNQIINMNKVCDLEDSKRIWTNTFNPYKQESSSPICLNYEDEQQLKFNKLQESNIKPDKMSNDWALNKMIERMGEDGFDSIGDDITKQEFIETEIFWETLD